MNFGKEQIVKKHKNLVSTRRRLTTKVFIILFKAMVFLLVLAVGAGGFLGLGVVKGIIDGAPDVENINITPVGEATKIYDSDGKVIDTLITDGSNRIPVALSKIPLNLQNAFIAIEDERFRTHNGVDIKGIFRAAYQTVFQGDLQGASTLTQQLLKNNVFEDGGFEDSKGALVRRKVQEIYLALKLEENLSKDIILENYLNTINLGSGCYGVQAAAQRYFNKDVSELTLSECSVIAAITQNPYGYNPIYRPEKNARRRASVLDHMLKQGYITNEEYTIALQDNVYDRIQQTSMVTADTSPYTYFVDELVKQVIKDLQEQKAYTHAQAVNALYSGGLKIYSTQDSVIQQICDEETNNPDNYPDKVYYSLEWAYSVKLDEPDENGNTQINYSQYSIYNYYKNVLGQKKFKLMFDSVEAVHECIDTFKAEVLKEGVTEIGENTIIALQPQVSFTVMDQKTGYVKAIVGGRGDKTASLSLNRATETTRQPGSCFKVLGAFAPAIDNYGYNLYSVIEDSPYYYKSNGRLVNNWWDKANTTADQRTYRGFQNFRYAIENSMNIITVKLLNEITPDAGFEYLTEFGFTTLVESKKNNDGTYSTDINESLALGGLTDGVTNMELCAAYAAIANGGVYTEPIYYTKVLDNSGKVILEKEPETKRVIKDSTAYLLTQAMHDVVITGTGTKANIKDMYVAGKTGTTSSSYDIWFAGYTPYLTATIWSGYDENKVLSNTSYHNSMWSKIMTRVHEAKGYKYAEFKKPDSIVTAQICVKCGNLAVEGLCDKDPEKSMIITGQFAAGNVPTENCVCHVEHAICNDSGLLAGEHCTNVTKNVYRFRYQGNDGTTWDSKYELPAELKDTQCTLHNGGTSILPPDNGSDTSSGTDTDNDSNNSSDNNTNNDAGSDSGTNNNTDSNNDTDNTPVP